eukprot:618410-Prymnesium_polylepis.1
MSSFLLWIMEAWLEVCPRDLGVRLDGAVADVGGEDDLQLVLEGHHADERDRVDGRVPHEEALVAVLLAVGEVLLVAPRR